MSQNRILIEGDKVRWTVNDKHVIGWGYGDDPNGLLVLKDEVYEILRVSGEGWTTFYEFKGLEGAKFNSALFSEV